LPLQTAIKIISLSCRGPNTQFFFHCAQCVTRHLFTAAFQTAARFIIFIPFSLPQAMMTHNALASEPTMIAAAPNAPFWGGKQQKEEEESYARAPRHRSTISNTKQREASAPALENSSLSSKCT